MATVFSPVSKLTAAEVERGRRSIPRSVHGMMAALRRMTPRNRGSIVNVGSALAYRSSPLQSVYCGAKFAIRGFTNPLRSEILHDKLNIDISMVDLPAVNTPQFNRALNKTGYGRDRCRRFSNPNSRARHLFRRVSPAPANLDRLSHRQGDPGKSDRPRPDRPLSGQRRLQRAVDQRGGAGRRAE